MYWLLIVIQPTLNYYDYQEEVINFLKSNGMCKIHKFIRNHEITR